jgi:chemotaxis protein CheD
MTIAKRYTVFPGQFIITTAPALISTVLGSCVSVCVWDKELKMAGMNHYLLPGDMNGETNDWNRGRSATRQLVRSLINRNARIENLEAKVFGGCNSLYQKNDLYRIGERNVEMAMNVLSELQIKVKAHHTGGAFGRKIVFNTLTGKVRMRLLNVSATVINEEINKGFSH